MEPDDEPDGVADLASANFSTNDVSILLGDGHGAFHPASAFPAGNGPVSLLAADWNEDGAPDLAVLDQVDVDVVQPERQRERADLHHRGPVLGCRRAHIVAIDDRARSSR